MVSGSQPARAIAAAIIATDASGARTKGQFKSGTPPKENTSIFPDCLEARGLATPEATTVILPAQLVCLKGGIGGRRMSLCQQETFSNTSFDAFYSARFQIITPVTMSGR